MFDTCRDESVKNITDTYADLGILNDTFIVLTTDNGGHPAAGGNNYPLRGQKATNFEGGVRGLAFVWGAGITDAVRGTVQHSLMHVTDWLPTLAAGAAGLDVSADGRPCPTCTRTVAPLDGVNQWPMLTTGAPSLRTEVLLGNQPTKCPPKSEGPCTMEGNGAIRIGKWKLMRGSVTGYLPATPCTARSGHGSKPNSTTLPIPANLSAPICVWGWNPPPQADPSKYELPHWPEDLNYACSSLPCNIPSNSTYVTGRIMLFDVVNDIVEEHDVAAENPSVVATLLNRLLQLNNTHCGGGPCPSDKKRPDAGPPGIPSNSTSAMPGVDVWMPFRGDLSNPGACSTDRSPLDPPPTPPNPSKGLQSSMKAVTIKSTKKGLMLQGSGWCFDAAWAGGGVAPMMIQLSVDGKPAEQMVANVERPINFPNASGAPNREHGFVLQEYGSWVDVLGSAGTHTLAVDVFTDQTAAAPEPTGPTEPVGHSPFCFKNRNLVPC